MILQPLVENAIKHGLEPKKEGGKIRIKAGISDGRLRITVADDGLGLEGLTEPNDDQGLGLNNISQRLADIYGDQAELIIKKNEPSGVAALVEVRL